MLGRSRVLLSFLFVLLVFASDVLSQTLVSFQDGVGGYSGTEDSLLKELDPAANFGQGTALWSDGNNSGGEIASLVKWDVSEISETSVVLAASVSFEFTNTSAGHYDILEQRSDWDEATVRWGNLASGGNVLGTIAPNSSGVKEIVLNATGVALVESWVKNPTQNFGLAIRSSGTGDGILMHSSDSTSGSHPKLSVTYRLGGDEYLQAQIDGLRQEVANLTALLAGVKRAGDTLVLEGMNLQIVNGLGSTDGSSGNHYHEDGVSVGTIIEVDDGQVNGLGNLIVGYDEDRYEVVQNQTNGVYQRTGEIISEKTGSHNVVIGGLHTYTSFGGLVAGLENKIVEPHSTVSGGHLNEAQGQFASVSGGMDNIARGLNSSVSGGSANKAEGRHASVSGGRNNIASGIVSSVSAGASNEASDEGASVSGGLDNIANNRFSSVSGGIDNVANGSFANVVGGIENTASGYAAVVSGGRNNEANGESSSVLGGELNIATVVDETIPQIIP